MYFGPWYQSQMGTLDQLAENKKEDADAATADATDATDAAATDAAAALIAF